MARAAASLFTPELVGPAVGASFAKLDPRQLIKNPVMFTTAVVALLSTVLLAKTAATGGSGVAFQAQLVFWLWLTVIFGNFAEALAEGRGKAQAASLRSAKKELTARRAQGGEQIAASLLKVGDLVRVETGELIPADGEVVEGVASVNEAAITGESAPVIREGGGDRSAVTAGTRGRVGLSRGAGHGGTGAGLPRPDDRADRRRAAPEDPERDRADHPARRG